MAASQISRKFRYLVLHNPALWSMVWLSRGNIDEEIDRVPTYLKRSLDYPLDIQLNCLWDDQTTDKLTPLLLPGIGRWKRLAITTADDHLLKSLEHVPAPFLERLDISYFSHHHRTSLSPNIFGSHLPRLSYLCVRNIDLSHLNFSLRTLKTLEIRGYGTWPTYARLQEMLEGSECLERLILHVKPSLVLEQVFRDRAVSQSGPTSQILLPELRTLEVCTSEWLTPSIAALVRLFLCPKIESLVVRENAETPHTIMNYARHGQERSNPLPLQLAERFDNLLCIQRASFNLACDAMADTTITTLELHKTFWPSHAQMKATFGSLKALRNLFIFDIDPNDAMLQSLRGREDESYHEVIQSLESSVLLPSLERLTIALHHADLPPELPRDCTAAFIRMFSLPALRDLHLRNLKREQWKAIADAFALHAAEYPALMSLTLANITDILPTDPTAPQYTSIVAAFPGLRALMLDSVPSNAILCQLVSRSARSMPCPGLRQISVCNDPNTSKPLLHRLIATRAQNGTPLEKLCLDKHFTLNAESWAWIQERVEVEMVSDYSL